MQTWRLILDGPGDGAWNMAVDRAVLHARQRGEVPATLRLYRWQRPTVTLGRNQSVSDVDIAACASLGFDVVRRPTGGRGVLHDDELTYSVVASLEDGIPRGVSASYRVLCGALVEAYRAIGVPASLTSRARGDKTAGACYMHATNADLSLGVAKLSGSAQVWDRDAVLQHGSFVRSRDIEAEARVFGLDSGAQSRLRDSTATLAGVLGEAPTLGAIADAVVLAFESVFHVRLQTGVLSGAEQRDAEREVAAFRVAETGSPSST